MKSKYSLVKQIILFSYISGLETVIFVDTVNVLPPIRENDSNLYVSYININLNDVWICTKSENLVVVDKIWT